MTGINADYYSLLADVCRQSYYQFVKHFWTSINKDTLVDNWHIRILCDELQAMAERVIRKEPNPYDLLINIAPGSSKSTICSVMLTPWVWTRMPHARVIGASYTDPIALDLSGKSRMVVESPLYKRCFPEIVLSKETNSKSAWANTKHGARYAVATGGSVTGLHGHLLVVDDPLNPSQARSRLELETANTWIKETFSSRKVDKLVSATILVMQRLHQDDPSTLFVSRGAKHYCLPAVITPKVSPIEMRQYYTEDGLFDPVRMPHSVLDRMKEEMGQYGFSGQMLQDPIPLGGGMFKSDRIRVADYAPPPSEFTKIVRGWDRACLLAGTKIRTKRGQIPIERVLVGDEVLTRKGWKKVTRSFLSKYTNELVTVLFSNGAQITGTSDHPVWTKNRGWIRLGSLGYGDYVLHDRDLQICQSSKQSNSKVGSIEDTKAEDTSIGIGKRGENKEVLPFTGTYGNTSTANVFPMATIYTTLTETGITTARKIWNVFPPRSTQIGTPKSPPNLLKIRLQIQQIEKEHKKRFGNGSRTTDTTRNEKKMHWQGALRLTPMPQYSTSSARFAVRTSQKKATKERGFALSNATIQPSPPKKRSRASLSARCVDLRLWGCAEKRPVDQFANKLAVVGTVPVYDLTVDGCPEFFANGILVHNSSVNYGDFTVGVKLGLHKDGTYWVLDIVRGQWGTEEREAKIKETAIRDGKRVRIGIEREPGSSGIDSAKATIKGLAGFLVEAIPATGKKEMRADTFSVQVNAGNVFIVEGHYVSGYIEELAFFPNGRHDDQVDASSLAFSMLSKQNVRLGVL